MEWKPPESTSDISRLNKLVTYYESVNLDQIQQIANLKQTHEANAKTILENEKNKKMLLKNVKSLEGRMKFDRIAADGMKKKFNLLEYEVREIKHTNEQMTAERNDDKSMIAQLKEDLNSNRSDKLKFMHENAILKKQAATLNLSETSANADAVFARVDLLDKLQALDNMLAQNDTQKRTISAQGEEMMTLSHEQHDLNEKLFAAKRQIVNLESMTAEYNRTIDILQHEISRLRKELASSSHSFNVKSSALLTRGGGTNPANRVSTDITHNSYGLELDGPYALSRRPHTQHSLSRERNQLASTGTSSVNGVSRSASRSQQRRPAGDSAHQRSEWSIQSSALPLLAECEHKSPSKSSQKEYQYVDLTTHLQRPTSSSTSAVLIAGGSIGTDGASLNTTVRTHLLQDYSDVIVAAQVGPSLRTAVREAPLSIATHASAEDLKSVGSTSSYTAMCSPISTPFRPLLSQTVPLKPLTVSMTKQQQQYDDPASWFQQRPGTKGHAASQDRSAHMNESLSSIQKCYSASTTEKRPSRKTETGRRVSTAAGRQEGTQALAAFSPDKYAASGEREAGIPSSPARVSFHPDDSLLTDKYNNNDKTQTKPSTAVKSRSKLPPPETNDKKSMFVGAGLGLKHNLELDAELRNLNKGSTHSILQKILGDRFD